MVAVTGKREVEECMATFENCLCDELPEMLACFWRASRKVVGDVWLGEGMLDFLENVWSKRWSVVRFLVLCRMVFLALWVVFWLCKVYAYGMWHGFERLSFATAKYYADDPRKACFWHDAFCRPEMFERR